MKLPAIPLLNELLSPLALASQSERYEKGQASLTESLFSERANLFSECLSDQTFYETCQK